MKWTPKNIQHSILPFTILNWIMGLSVLEYPLGKTRPVFTFVYVFVINLVYWYANKVDEVVSKPIEYVSIIQNDIFKLLKYGNMLIATFSIFAGWYYYKDLKFSIRRLELIDDTLERLGCPKNYGKTFKKSLVKAVMWIIMIFVLVLLDMEFLLNNIIKTVRKCLHVIYMFHFPIHLNSLVDFTFTIIIDLIGVRFKNINLLLKSEIPKYPALKITVGRLCANKKRSKAIFLVNELNIKVKFEEQHKGLFNVIRHLHMELSKISCEINNIYQKQMTLGMATYFFSITGLLYNLFVTIFFNHTSFSKKYKSMLNISLWLFAFLFRFININITCARVSLESLKTREILYDLKIENEELKDEIEQFLFQITQRPLVFTACGFSTLDCAFIQRFIGSITTFLVILIQFSPKSSESGS